MQGPALNAGPPMTCAEIPADHLDLVERPLDAALSTLFADGTPQTQPVWFSYEPPHLLINTMRGFSKERNLRRDPRATLLVIDSLDTARWLEVQGVTELTEVGSQAHLDSLALRYAGVPHFFGGCVPAELAGQVVPVIGRIRPLRIVHEASAERPIVRAPSSSRVQTVLSPRREAVPVPASHQDLLDRPLIAVLTTLMPDGHPHTEPVSFSFEDGEILVNTARECQMGSNLERDHRATILVVDPANSNRWIEIRGDVEIEQPRTEGRIVARLRPRRVVCDAIYSKSR